MKDRPLSRQRRRQLALVARGLCQTYCGRRISGGFKAKCRICGMADRLRSRLRYRARVGIPLDAPLDPRGGKPRVRA